MKRLKKTTVSFPPQMEQDLELLHQLEGIAKSEIVRAAVSDHLRERIDFHLRSKAERVVLGLEDRRDETLPNTG